jgi:hypothetical protein
MNRKYRVSDLRETFVFHSNLRSHYSTFITDIESNRNRVSENKENKSTLESLSIINLIPR